MRFFFLFCFFALLSAQSPEFKTIGTLQHPEFSECSGIDTYLENYFVGLNDSGNAPKIFVFDAQGNDHGSFLIQNAENRDWEDLAVEGNTLYIGEIGDNRRIHPSIFILQVELPKTPPGSGKEIVLPIQKTYEAKYPDGPHDCEALFIRNGKIHLITKNRGDLHQCFVLTETEGKTYLEKCGDLDLSPNYQITGADYQNGTLVVSTYSGWMLFPEPLVSTPPLGTLHTKTQQLESVCFWNDSILWTGEYREFFQHTFVQGSQYYLPPKSQAWLNYCAEEPASWSHLIPESAKIAWTSRGFWFDLQLDTLAEENRFEQVVLGWDPKLSYSLFYENQPIFVVASEGEKVAVFQKQKKNYIPVSTENAQLRTEDGKKWFRFFLPIPERLQPGQKGAFFLSFEKKITHHFGAQMSHYAWEKPYIWGEVTLDVPVSSSQLTQHISFLSTIEPARNYRNVDSLNRVAEYIQNEWRQLQLPVEEQTYLVQGKTYKNIMTYYGPTEGERVVIGAHYDVCGDQPGADDNATGVSALLELTRLLVRFQPKISYRLDFVAYSLEEPPYFRSEFMGSAVHAKSLIDQKIKVKAMFSLEMLGFFTEKPKSQEYPLKPMYLLYPSQGNFIAVVGNGASQDVVNLVQQKIKEGSRIPVQSLVAPTAITGVDFSDHLNYWNHGIKAIMITDTSFYRNANYHKVTDTLDTLNIEKMGEVVKGLYWTLLHLE